MPALAPEPSPIIRFGAFELDRRAQQLRMRGAPVKLACQSYLLLTALLERPGEVVARCELRERLWPDGTFVDFEGSLNAAVRRLRAVLGDNAANPQFIETLSRRGYRFVTPVIECPEPAALAREAVEPETKANWSDYRLAFLSWAIIALLLVFVAGAVAVSSAPQLFTARLR